MEQLTKLKNGSEEMTAMVIGTGMALRSLIEQNPIAIFELVEVCENPSHAPFGNTGQILIDRALMEPDGRVHDSIRNIVLSSIEGEGLQMCLVDPRAERVPESTPSQDRMAITAEDKQVFQAIKKIGNVIFSYCNNNSRNPKNKIWLENRMRESVNPYYNQVKSGLFLEMYYGQPSALYTPWGKKQIGGSGSHGGDENWEKYWPEITERLGLTLKVPLKVNNMGEFGPVYAVHSVDGEVLPEPIMKPSRGYSYEESEKVWEELEASNA